MLQIECSVGYSIRNHTDQSLENQVQTGLHVVKYPKSLMTEEQASNNMEKYQILIWQSRST